MNFKLLEQKTENHNGVVCEVHLRTVEIYENAGARQPEQLHAGFVEGELCA